MLNRGRRGLNSPADRLQGGRDRPPIVREIGRQSWQRLSARIGLTDRAKYRILRINSPLRSRADFGDRPPAFVGVMSGSLIVGRHSVGG